MTITVSAVGSRDRRKGGGVVDGGSGNVVVHCFGCGGWENERCLVTYRRNVRVIGSAS